MINKIYLYREEAELEAYKLQHARGYRGTYPATIDIVEDDCVAVAPAVRPAPLLDKVYPAVELRSYEGQVVRLGWIHEANTLGGLAGLCNGYAITPKIDSTLIRHACIRNKWVYLRDVEERNFKNSDAIAYDPENRETLVWDKRLGYVLTLQHPEYILRKEVPVKDDEETIF